MGKFFASIVTIVLIISIIISLWGEALKNSILSADFYKSLMSTYNVYPHITNNVINYLSDGIPLELHNVIVPLLKKDITPEKTQKIIDKTLEDIIAYINGQSDMLPSLNILDIKRDVLQDLKSILPDGLLRDIFNVVEESLNQAIPDSIPLTFWSDQLIQVKYYSSIMLKIKFLAFIFAILSAIILGWLYIKQIISLSWIGISIIIAGIVSATSGFIAEVYIERFIPEQAMNMTTWLSPLTFENILHSIVQYAKQQTNIASIVMITIGSILILLKRYYKQHSIVKLRNL